MADLEFPLPLGVEPEGGVSYDTTIIRYPEPGTETRNANRENGLIKYRCNVSPKSRAEIGQAIKFFRARKGAWQAWLLEDPGDFKSLEDMQATVTPLDQVIGTGDGSTVDFQLVKTYLDTGGSEVRNITKPRSGTVRVAVNGSELTEGPDFTVDYATGLVTLTTPAPFGQSVTAGYHFLTQVRFVDDDQVLAFLNLELGEWASFQVIEV